MTCNLLQRWLALPIQYAVKLQHRAVGSLLVVLQHRPRNGTALLSAGRSAVLEIQAVSRYQRCRCLANLPVGSSKGVRVDLRHCNPYVHT